MLLRRPRPLLPGDRIGVTAPSSGVPDHLRPRMEYAGEWLAARGYEVVWGDCLDGARHVSASKGQRASELTAMLTDPTIAAVLPPWGGETAIDLLGQLDWEALAVAEPTWLVGFSDISTLMVPITVRMGWWTIHGCNLMDTPYQPEPGLVHWLDLATALGSVVQHACGVFGRNGYGDWRSDPADHRYRLDEPGSWSLWGADELDATGVLIGGCIETLVNVAGTPFGDVEEFGRAHAETGLIVYVEAAGDDAFTICRNLHGLRYAGWFDHANAVLVGRTSAPDGDTLTQREAVLDALDGLGVPIVFDVECGHVPPYLPLVNGALARVESPGVGGRITQQLAANAPAFP
jgi:muramoyltetrapeptide carboxypeptidase LdcA involved in peptidoglycan recycling